MKWDGYQDKLLKQGLQELYSRLCKSPGNQQIFEALDFQNSFCEALSEYAQILLKWQETFHVLGPQSIESFVSLHLLDSVSGALFLVEQDIIINEGYIQIIDVGSGLGLPGIPLALCFQLLQERFSNRKFKIVLVESASRRGNILLSILAELHRWKLPVEVYICPIEEWHKYQNEAQNEANGELYEREMTQRIVTCRAFRSLNKKSWKQLLYPLVDVYKYKTQNIDTGVLLYKGNWAKANAELNSLLLRPHKKLLFELPQSCPQRSLWYITPFS